MQYVPRQTLTHTVCCELGKTAVVVERDNALAEDTVGSEVKGQMKSPETKRCVNTTEGSAVPDAVRVSSLRGHEVQGCPQWHEGKRHRKPSRVGILGLEFHLPGILLWNQVARLLIVQYTGI